MCVCVLRRHKYQGVIGQMKTWFVRRKKREKKKKNDKLSNKQHTWVEKRKTLTFISTKIIYGFLVSTLFLG